MVPYFTISTASHDSQRTTLGNPRSQLIIALNKCDQLFHLLNEYIDLKNLWMTSPDLWNSNERKSLCYLKLNKEKSREK